MLRPGDADEVATALGYACSQELRPAGAPSFVQLINIYAGDDDRGAVKALTPLLDIGRVLEQDAVRAPYAAVLPSSEGPHSGGPRRPLVGSGLAVHLSRTTRVRSA